MVVSYLFRSLVALSLKLHCNPVKEQRHIYHRHSRESLKIIEYTPSYPARNKTARE